MLIFEKSEPFRQNRALFPYDNLNVDELSDHLREDVPVLPEVSELQVIRHYTQLSQKNFSIDTNFYPLGSCTMKYNPKCAHSLASLPGFLNRHPLSEVNQGYLSILYELQEMLKQITGMSGVCLTPMAGAQGEFAGVAMIRAYHKSRGLEHKNEMLIPDSAHGTNPASAVMCGYQVKEISTLKNGDLDLETLKMKINENTAGIMLTNPSTIGVFERQIHDIAALIHQVDGLLYYDGANLNAIAGKVRPGDMGFDVMHMNLHKTFATPHGGGGPGGGPIATNDKLLPYLPVPTVCLDQGQYVWIDKRERPESIGRLSAFMGNAGVLVRAYIYLRLLGWEGVERISEFAVLNANYLMRQLENIGMQLAFPNRRASHEFIVTFKEQSKKYDLNAMDFAKLLIDYKIHAPTTYFPLTVPECWLIEPTETETKATLDHFVSVAEQLLHQAEASPQGLKEAPKKLPVGRLDEVKAARELEIVWRQ